MVVRRCSEDSTWLYARVCSASLGLRSADFNLDADIRRNDFVLNLLFAELKKLTSSLKIKIHCK